METFFNQTVPFGVILICAAIGYLLNEFVRWVWKPAPERVREFVKHIPAPSVPEISDRVDELPKWEIKKTEYHDGEVRFDPRIFVRFSTSYSAPKLIPFSLACKKWKEDYSLDRTYKMSIIEHKDATLKTFEEAKQMIDKYLKDWREIHIKNESIESKSDK